MLCPVVPTNCMPHSKCSTCAVKMMWTQQNWLKLNWIDSIRMSHLLSSKPWERQWHKYVQSQGENSFSSLLFLEFDLLFLKNRMVSSDNKNQNYKYSLFFICIIQEAGQCSPESSVSNILCRSTDWRYLGHLPISGCVFEAKQGSDMIGSVSVLYSKPLLA